MNRVVSPRRRERRVLWFVFAAIPALGGVAALAGFATTSF